jgi:hypothetical protein
MVTISPTDKGLIRQKQMLIWVQKSLFQGDGTFSASIDALPPTIFTKMEDSDKSNVTLKRNISAPTKMTYVQSAISIPTLIPLFITFSLQMQLYFRNRHGNLWLLNLIYSTFSLTTLTVWLVSIEYTKLCQHKGIIILLILSYCIFWLEVILM